MRYVIDPFNEKVICRHMFHYDITPTTDPAMLDCVLTVDKHTDAAAICKLLNEAFEGGLMSGMHNVRDQIKQALGIR